MADVELVKKQIWEEIGKVEDPEIGLTLVELGLIYDVTVSDDLEVNVTMTFTSMGCPFGPQLQAQVQAAASRPDGVGVAEVEVVFAPPWDPHTMANEDAKMTLGIY